MSIYMKFPTIDGPVSLKGFDKQCELLSAEHEVSRQINTQPGHSANREGSRPHVGEFVITKKMCQATPRLYQEACVGNAVDEVVITRVTTSGSAVEYATYTLNNVMISKHKTVEDLTAKPATKEGQQDNKHAEFPIETIHLNFDKIKVKYTVYDSKNRPKSPIISGYDVTQGTAL